MPGIVPTLLQKIFFCTKWSNSTRKQGRCAQKLDSFQLHLFLTGSCPNLCNWGHSMKYGDVFEIGVVIFGAQVVGLRENVFKVVGTGDS